ncbi:VOC family protein [Leptospira sp. 2 VSF19]|uniref:VOC family protein n=1 Tax=Leptospira soteropolitanensis TaxID=2950025 RepID=A0AAW5VJG5_9LEPT|nr:VOC family protein [Leptospira soteropolitanensis]MCW7492627.1 VOC family protein [Leptospira soteropolitanensis]MCW7500310.1 VOC family protein [Leptospira soteropolitanensis]MCW7522655.1 VOC family protein [Leptospira soteropolitanensis]MCW7526511.1 VOC family protein [Leptospira soteropolitanensis]MCW7530280.1 VOC family protein [Leptospira soteropolitanensis]
MIHHIAIGTANPSRLAEFYLKIPGSKKIKEFHYESGILRSVWIEFGSILVMLEEGENKSPRALVFSYQEFEKSKWTQFLKQTKVQSRTEYTVYFLDPDGNLLGASSYPEKLESLLEMS